MGGLGIAVHGHDVVQEYHATFARLLGLEREHELF
jgi:hypothetical protein